MADSSASGASLTRAVWREELDRFRNEMYRELCHCATKTDGANFKTWVAGLLLLVVLNVLGTDGTIVAVVLTRLVGAPTAGSLGREFALPRATGARPDLGKTDRRWVPNDQGAVRLPARPTRSGADEVAKAVDASSDSH